MATRFSSNAAGKFRLVIFNHVLARLTDEEICAVAACAIGRINRCHNAARLFFFIGLSTLFWWGLAFLSEKTWFYASLNIEPSLAIPNGAINPGLLFAICIAVVPVVLYPLSFWYTPLPVCSTMTKMPTP